MVPFSNAIARAAGAIVSKEGKGATGPCLALDNTEVKEVFTALLQEIKTRIDHESKRLATVPA
jgi:hypothetical protein